LFQASILFPNIVNHIEDLFQSLYYLFFHSPKRHIMNVYGNLLSTLLVAS
jgi:hypothetical protein